MIDILQECIGRILTDGDVLHEVAKGFGLEYSLDDMRPRSPYVIIPGEPGPFDKNRTIILPGQEGEIPQIPQF